MQDERDDRIEQAIDKALAALRQARPPEGIEARIERRLQQHQHTSALRPGWSGILRGSTLGGAWFRGAFSGACVAVAVVAVFLSLHRSTPAPQSSSAPIAYSSGFTQTFPRLVLERHSAPCTPALQQAQAAPAPHPTEIARGALPEHYHQPLDLPLTRQERDLVRLVHIAGPQQLARLNSESQERAEAQEADTFRNFFAPPPVPQPISDTPADSSASGQSAPAVASRGSADTQPAETAPQPESQQER